MPIDQEDAAKSSPTPTRSRWATIGTSLLVMLQSACSSGDDPPAGKVAHGPFEVVASVKRISTTNLWQSGGLFATRGVSEFQVQWRGKTLVTPAAIGSFGASCA